MTSIQEAQLNDSNATDSSLSREAFEAWYGDISPLDRTKQPPGEADYLWGQTQGAWETWCLAYQAAMEHSRVDAKQPIGIACMKHDLVHSIACGHCLREAEAELSRLREENRVLVEACRAADNELTAIYRHHIDKNYTCVAQDMIRIALALADKGEAK